MSKTKRLIDKAIITVRAGNGGDGRVSFRREKYIPKGGPDGGDGGRGGNVYLYGDHNMATLLDFRAKTKYEAQDGEMGGKKKMAGKGGDDLYIKLPIGTLVYEKTEQGEVLVGDIDETISKENPLLIAQGGYGGKGNDRFKSSSNRTPTQFTHGRKGQQKDLRLEIKLVADVGLIGFPNAGKSTLINNITTAKADVGSYPFTTLVPNLGPMKLKNNKSIVIADIPGLIAGASEGKGLGDDFLRHIERTRILVHLVDPMSYLFENNDEDVDTDLLIKSALKSYDDIRAELSNFKANLDSKPEIVVINKIDITEVSDALSNIISAFKKRKIKVFGISAVTGENLDKLEDEIIKALKKAPKKIVFEVDKQPVKIFTPDNLPNRRMVE